MMKSLMPWILAVAVAGGFGCKKKEEAPVAPAQAAQEAPAAAPELPAGPIAKVNGVAIDGTQFKNEIKKITQGGARTIPEDRLAKIRENILNRLIEEELLAQEIRKQDIQVSPEELAAEFEKYKARFKGEEQFQNYLKHGKTTVEEIQKRLTASLALTKLLVKMGKLEITDEDVRKTYDTGIKMYTEPEQVHAMHLLVKASENAPADQVAAA
ncbi:MAG TPA: SurA N-terminal domain-containing protein, partial [Myxococcota bacterium]|nr:SurA N-terminal domain-containing protein [Myxococcota bacterium]